MLIHREGEVGFGQMALGRMDQGRGKREEGRGKREEGRGKREEGREKREEGRGKREEGTRHDTHTVFSKHEATQRHKGALPVFNPNTQ